MKTGKAVGGSLGAIAILILAQLLAQLLAVGLEFLQLPAAICNIAAGILYFGFAFFLLKIFAEKILKMPLPELGIPSFRLQWKWVLTGILLPVLVTGVYLLLPGRWVGTQMETAQAAATVCTGVFFTGLGAGFVEEMVFRGFILNLLDKRWNKVVAILVPSLLFGSVHVIGMGFSLGSSLLVIAAGTLVGVMFSLIQQENHSVWDSGIVHALWNVVILGGVVSVFD